LIHSRRTAIPIERANKTANPSKILKYQIHFFKCKNKKQNDLYRCSVLNVTGFTSPHKDDVIDTNDRCDPATTSYVEFADCGGAVLDEQPAKLAESIRLFLQGLGYSKNSILFFKI
jgi:hypothetical protein